MPGRLVVRTESLVPKRAPGAGNTTSGQGVRTRPPSRGNSGQTITEAALLARGTAREDGGKALARRVEPGWMRIYAPTAAERVEFTMAMIRTSGEVASRRGREAGEAIFRATVFDPSRL